MIIKIKDLEVNIIWTHTHTKKDSIKRRPKKHNWTTNDHSLKEKDII